MEPETSRTIADLLIAWGLKALALLATFLGGVVSATWVLAQKCKAYDCQIAHLKEEFADLQKELSSSASSNGTKLDRLHERIDDILMAAGFAPQSHLYRQGKRENKQEGQDDTPQIPRI
ncbi:MAG: hypothetical protein RBS34_00585 [Desulfofustis sp.]|jgi:hypothetical protein|nr:hypothetical protein [Desulfofustis sp.]